MLGAATGALAQKRGGELNFVVGSKIPSYDGHVETTFGMIHPIRPFYSLLIRVNPDNPASPTDFVCDLCEGEVPKGADGGKSFTFKIRKGVKFHDGTPLTAHDVAATFNKIVFPPQGVASSRKAFFKMVDKIEATDDTTLTFTLKFPSGAFMPAVALPFNFVYAKKDLDTHGYTWHKKNINGTGAFSFVEHQPGAFVKGKRYDGYHHKGKPYLDGFTSISAPKMALRLQAIRGDRASIEFRGFPPKARDDLKKALGDKITVQEGDWNCGLFLTPNQLKKPFDDPRVRRALNLAIDRWGGSKYLSRIAIVKTVGGAVFPNHPLATKKDELTKLEGYRTDVKASRELAKKLLKGGGPSQPQVRALQPRRRPALQGRRHLGHRPVEEDRRRCQAGRGADGCVVLAHAPDQGPRRDHRRQLPVRGQPDRGHLEVPVLGRQQPRQLQGPGARGHLRQAGSRR